MKTSISNVPFSKTTLKIIYYSLATLLISIFQISFSFLISIYNISPDLLILLVIWITLAEGKIFGLIAGFLIGLFFDFVSLNVLGVNAFTKTLVAFIAGFFYNEGEFNLMLKSNGIFIITFIAVFVHNIFFYLLMVNLTKGNFWTSYFKYLVGSTFYTFVFSLLTFFLRIKKLW
ncbi:MAG: rod shape-determining protein MreD [Ignavibacteria bacterium]|nr:rod shape-determining protein MreD [Ignavibacteria bacterium]